MLSPTLGWKAAIVTLALLLWILAILRAVLLADIHESKKLDLYVLKRKISLSILLSTDLAITVELPVLYSKSAFAGDG